MELRDLALYQLRPLLSTVPGVARVGVQGRRPGGISGGGQSGPLGQLQPLPGRSRPGRFRGQCHYRRGPAGRSLQALTWWSPTPAFTTLKQIGQTILRSGKDGLVRLEDIATVTAGHGPPVDPGHRRWPRRRHLPGLPATRRQHRADRPGLSKKHWPGSAPTCPAGITIANWYDQSQLILASASSVRDAILIGILCAVLILWLFLRNLRMTLIAAVIVPCVLGATILLLYVLHMSFNIMTLGGMAAAVGLIIDDMIVMEEQIVRRLRQSAAHHR